MLASAFASPRSDPVSRAHCQRKRDEGKRHNQTVLALAHHRTPTPHTTIRNNALYDPQRSTTTQHTTQEHPHETGGRGNHRTVTGPLRRRRLS